MTPRGSNVVWVGGCTEQSAFAAFEKATSHIQPSPRTTIKTIAIKINICDYRRAESGAITHPLVLGSLLQHLRLLFPSAAIYILENDATSLDIRSAYRLLGFEEVARRHDSALVNVAEGEWIIKAVPHGLLLQELEVPAILESADLFINFAKLKTNALTKITGCLKNLFGLLRQKRKVVFHPNIDAIVTDMNKVIKPDLCLVDGIIGMEGIGGPAFGRPKRCNLLIGGTNPVSVDSVAARIMGFRPLSVGHIRLSDAAAIGTTKYELISDIPAFDYSVYKFRFEYTEYLLRKMLRGRAGVA